MFKVSVGCSTTRVSVVLSRAAFRWRQARTRQRPEQYTAVLNRSTPTVHDLSQTGHFVCTPTSTTVTRCRFCCSFRH
ncbi:hypothetical protein [Streptomyces sp. NPDC051554]|uniref:hypothetical protein n=1 Tax=Streptomyces sp. NPDC051554 TaxID=3365656 RepID=UPI0037BB8AEC